ncbi:phosphoenolpyruvate--protein phosphotransferase [Tautonia sociabilis]|uniref:Phosphoenolpyruvate-protein phosphotransferase n=1 Tax=Tautonia sociabilis TaxID=2080755 RepID=A0A432MMH3_9BACT|nr:phosphoenolpyruvate--protein phosphotransferase [Tautonia sociabilis]RUL88439.1 phosphoenolpyruvate--protein phosphotransferase [Tautonia sociabilis]
MYKGIAVSPGVVVGVAYCLDGPLGQSEVRKLPDEAAIPEELERFDRALRLAAEDLDLIVAKVAVQIGGEESDIFRSHLQILRDPSLLAKVHEGIKGARLTAPSALQAVLKEYASVFARSGQELFQERMADLRDVFARITAHLDASPAVDPALAGLGSDEPIVLVTHEILPSQAISLGEMPIAGIVTEVGGGTSHAAILSRSRGIPAVSGAAGIIGQARTGDQIVIDGRDGIVVLRPDAEMLVAYRKMQRDFFELKDRLVINRDQPACLSDGTLVELLANVNTVADAATASGVGASGVGLYRTEYLFLTHPDVPDEEEQYENYRKVVEAAPDRTATIRTLDLGGDKTVPYLGRQHEANPFMGWRSIRLSFEHPKFFEVQIRAILRAARHGKVSILFPMITTLEELRHVNRLVDEARRNLKRAGIPYGEDVKTGVMIEVPAAALCIEALLQETDFISIGSNDLIQYLVAADRDNPKVAHLCDPLSPAVLRMLRMVFDACRRTGTPVTLCGEMAGQPRSVLVLLGLGLRRFSMSPAFVPTIKTLLSSVSTPQAERFTHQVLQLKTRDEIRRYLTERLHEISKDLELFDFT